MRPMNISIVGSWNTSVGRFEGWVVVVWRSLGRIWSHIFAAESASDILCIIVPHSTFTEWSESTSVVIMIRGPCAVDNVCFNSSISCRNSSIFGSLRFSEPPRASAVSAEDKGQTSGSVVMIKSHIILITQSAEFSVSLG